MREPRFRLTCTGFLFAPRVSMHYGCPLTVSELEQNTAVDPGEDVRARATRDPASAVLTAAEDAAEQIRVDAQRRAGELLHRAEHSTESKIAELTQAADDASREAGEYARDMRMAVEAYAKKHRQDAEEEARRLVADAEARAKSIIESAREDTQRLDADERGRQEALRAETQRLEEGRRQALDGVRELAAILEELLEDAHAPRGPTLDETLGDPRTLGRRSG